MPFSVLNMLDEIRTIILEDGAFTDLEALAQWAEMVKESDLVS